MAASVRIDATAFSDPRIEMVGKLAGYNRFEALGRLAHLWSYCTDKESPIVSKSVVTATMGGRGVMALLDSGLGTDVDGEIRVHGTEGRIEWLSARRSASRRGGAVTKAKTGKSRTSGLINIAKRGPNDSQTIAKPEPNDSPLTLTLSLTQKHKPPISPSGGSSERRVRRKSAKTAIPPSWQANESHRAKALSLGVDLEKESERFKLSAEANGRVYADWDKAFHSWLASPYPKALLNGHAAVRQEDPAVVALRDANRGAAQ